MKNLDKMLAEIKRISKPGAWLIIREHDLGHIKFQEVNKKLFMLEHAFYEILFDNVPYEKFINDYYECYKTMDEWENLLLKNGFKKIKSHYIKYYNPTNYYYSLYSTF